MKHLALIPALGLSSVLLLSPTARAQSLAEVEEAVTTYFDSDEQRIAAQANLARWGDGAVVHLRTLANRQGSSIGWPVVVCAFQIGTAQSTDLILDILDGKTAIAPSQATGVLVMFLKPTEGSAERLRKHLESSSRFKPVLRRLAESGSWLDKSLVAQVAAELKWKDFEPAIRKMLENDNVVLQKEAAKALERLTGRSPKVELPEPAFPKVDLIPDLVMDPVSLEGSGFDGVTQASFFRRGHDAPSLMLGDGLTFASYPRRDDSSTLRFALSAIDMHVLEVPGQRQLVALTSESGFDGAGADCVISWSEQGQELWRYVPPNRGLDAAAILYGDDGPYGVAFGPGGETGVVAVDVRGHALWDIPRTYVLYELETHPRLPGTILIIGGQFFMARHAPAGVERDDDRADLAARMRSGTYLYGSTGVLFPGPDGTPQMLIAGTGKDSRPLVTCFDAESRAKWCIRLAHRVTGLEMLEVSDDDRLFVVTTAGGEMFVVDPSGTLRWEGRLPGTTKEEEAMVFELAVGRYGPDEAAIALRNTHGFYVVPIRLKAIREME